jgi:two-component system response regulator
MTTTRTSQKWRSAKRTCRTRSCVLETASRHCATFVVLLDLNLPRVGGLEVLKSIRTVDSTKHLPVVVLTSSDEDRDRLEAYAHFANSYVRKPVDYEDFVEASRRLGLYWTVTNVPPPHR